MIRKCLIRRYRAVQLSSTGCCGSRGGGSQPEMWCSVIPRLKYSIFMSSLWGNRYFIPHDTGLNREIIVIDNSLWFSSPDM